MRSRVEDFHSPVQKQSPRVGQETLLLDQIQQSLQKPLNQRCEDVTKMINEFPLKDLHLFYPHLLASIFGSTSKKGWALHSGYSRYIEGLRNFLGPQGIVWNLVEKLERDSFLRYEFPVTCLPRPTQLLLAEGYIPALYYNKVQFSGGNQTPLVVSLGALEYFLFQLTYFITQCNPQTEGRFLERGHETLYTALLTDYLEHFLPTNVPLPRSERYPGGVYPRTEMKRYFTTPEEPHLRSTTPFTGLIKTFDNKPTPYAGSFDQSSPQMIQSETFLQILIEFWLNHLVDKETVSTFSPFGQDYFLPTVDHVRVVRMLVKHLHSFMNVNVNPYEGGGSNELNEDFYRTVMPESLKMFKKRLYWFINHCFAQWPLDPSFRFILETWLSYIQPWRYRNVRPYQNRDGASEMFSLHWKPFIRHNLLFYTVVLQEFLNRAEKLNLRSSRDTQLFYRVTKVFSQRSLMPVVTEVERDLLTHLSSLQQGLVQRSRSPKSAEYSHFTELQIPGTAYRPLFMEETINNVRFLIHHTENTLQSLREPQNAHSQTSQNIGWFKSRIKDTINWLQDVFSIDEHYWLIQDENRKAQKNLEYICEQLRTIFQIRADDHEETVQWAREVGETSSMSRVTSQKDSNETQPDCVETEKGIVLTSLGKYQMANGLRHFNIQYSGDPDLQPVRSYEVVFLVRGLYKLSTILNEKVGPQLSRIYYSPGWSGSLARHLSPAVQKPRTLSPVKYDRSRASFAPGQPKISLRYLASSRLWAQLLLLLFFFKFVLGRPWSAALLITFILFFMFLRNIYVVQRQDDRLS